MVEETLSAESNLTDKIDKAQTLIVFTWKTQVNNVYGFYALLTFIRSTVHSIVYLQSMSNYCIMAFNYPIT